MLTAPGPVDGQGHAVGEILVDTLVASHAQRVDVLKLEDDAVSLRLRHPLVQAKKGRLEPTFEQDVTLVVALCCQGVSRHVFPAQPLQ